MVERGPPASVQRDGIGRRRGADRRLASHVARREERQGRLGRGSRARRPLRRAGAARGGASRASLGPSLGGRCRRLAESSPLGRLPEPGCCGRGQRRRARPPRHPSRPALREPRPSIRPSAVAIASALVSGCRRDRASASGSHSSASSGWGQNSAIAVWLGRGWSNRRARRRVALRMATGSFSSPRPPIRCRSTS